MENDKELANIDLGKIYMAWSEFNESDFDCETDTEFLYEIIEKNFPQKIKHIDIDNLKDNTNLINAIFVKLIKECLKVNYKKGHLIFITMCDYFDLDFNKTFLQLHENLQTIIKVNTKKFIGSAIYNKYKLKQNNGLVIRTLNDLIKK